MRTLLRATLRLLGQLPLWLLHGCGWLLGTLLWLTPNKLKRITLLHLRICFPEHGTGWRRQVAWRSLVESGKAVMEAPAIWFGSSRRLRAWCDDTRARDVLLGLLAKGRGLILLTPHLGSWELAGQFCASAGAITLLYKPQKGAADQVILEGRSRTPGAHLVPTNAGGVRELLGALRRGEMIGLLPDHDPPERSGTHFAPLFGVPANTMDLVGKLAVRSGAPVWFIVAERRCWGRGFRIHLEPAPAGITDPVNSLTALNHGLERCIAARPQQYWWSYKRYRRQPPGAAEFYADV